MKTTTSKYALWAGLLLCSAGMASAADSVVTFRVDLTLVSTNGSFTPGSSSVFARGSFNNWSTGEFFDGTGSSALTNDPSASGLATNIYTGTFHDTNDVNGGTLQYKYYIDTGALWENDIGNRTGTLPANPGDALVLPVVYFDDKPPALPITNDVTFQVDMTVQTQLGKFTPGTDNVYARGNLQGWGPGLLMTNDPGGANTNIYSCVYSAVDGPGFLEHYKYFIDNGSVYESPSAANVDGTGNRYYHLLTSPGSVVLPLVLFSDQTIGDVLAADTLVTFSVNMTNANPTDGLGFAPGADDTGDRVYLNGDWLGWWSWGPVSPPADFALTNHPGTSNYSITVLLPKGSVIPVTYKYSVRGPDNEAQQNHNHFRFIRTVGNYTMPLDTFGNQFVESSFGNLSVGSPSASHVPVSWVGRPGVHLQTTTSLAPSAWQNLLETDGAGWTNGYISNDGFVSVTNYPTGGSHTYFRLIKPGS